MMLKTVKNAIEKIKQDNTSFSEFYMNYVLEIQDESLEREISYMLKNKIYDVNLVDRAIINSLESLVRLYGNDEY